MYIINKYTCVYTIQLRLKTETSYILYLLRSFYYFFFICLHTYYIGMCRCILVGVCALCVFKYIMQYYRVFFSLPFRYNDVCDNDLFSMI